MLGAVAVGQELAPALYRPAAAPAASSFLMWKEGMAAIEGKVTKAGRRGPARTSASRQRIVGGQWLGVLLCSF